MQDLISREEIEKIMNIGQSQFKAFKRYGLIDGYVKKKSIVRLDEKRTKQKGREAFAPAGFTYLYPRTVLSQISWILEQRKVGKNLTEIHNEFIRKRIQEDEELRRRAHTYEKVFTVPAGSAEENGAKQKLVRNAVTELTERIRKDNPDRDIKRLVFLVEPEKHQTQPNFNISFSARLDVESSQF